MTLKMPKRPLAKKKRPASKYERVIRKKKMVYKCTSKSETIKHITFQEKNEHGAMNNIIKSLPYVCLTFSYQQELNRALDINEEAPIVLGAQFAIETRDKVVADKYQVGGEYKELPTSV